MPILESQSEASTAIRIDLSAIFISLELSRSKWLVTSLSPGAGEKMSKHVLAGSDMPGLLAHIAGLQRKTKARTGRHFPIVSVQEAGLDGFWIHRILECEGVESYIVDPASIATSRLNDALPRRGACKRMVALLAREHEEVCEAELTGLLSDELRGGGCPTRRTSSAAFRLAPGRGRATCS